MVLFFIGLVMLLGTLFAYALNFFSKGFILTDLISMLWIFIICVFLIVKGLKNMSTRKEQAALGKPIEPVKLSPRAKKWIFWVVIGNAAILLMGLMGGIVVESTLQEPERYADMPEEFFTMKGRYAVYDKKAGSRITVRFTTDVRSLDGLWYGKDAYVTINGESYNGIPGVASQPWGDIKHSTGTRLINPTLTAYIDLQEEDIHQVLNVEAEMNCCYIEMNGKTSYTAYSTPLNKTFDIFVITKEEDRYEKRGLNITIFAVCMAGIIGICVLVWFLLFRRKKTS